MSNLDTQDVTDLGSARAFLGNRQVARLCNNTTIRHGLGGDIIVTYHATDIVTYCNDGATILRADGWVTATTATRLHKLTPAHVRVGRKGDDFRVTINDGKPDTWDGQGAYVIAAR